MSSYYNVKQSTNDYRDIIFDKLVSSELSLLPQCNYISDLLPIRDQGLQGTCFAQSAACMKEWQEKRDIGLNEYLSPNFFTIKETIGIIILPMGMMQMKIME